MSLLPGTILPQGEPLGRLNDDGTVTIDKNWWLLLYNLSLQVLGNGTGLPAVALVGIEGTDNDVTDSDAVALRQPIANLAANPFADPTPTTADFPDIARALLLAQEPILPDPAPLAQPAAAIVVGGSPFTYSVPFRGAVVVTGGTVLAINLVRQSATVALGMVAGIIPVSQFDKLVVTYSATPTMTFLPT